MKWKILIITLYLLPFVARADSQLISLMCATESEFKSSKNTHGVMIIDIKSSGDGVGYAVTKFMSNDGSIKLGMTYFKASGQKVDDSVLFTTRQNPDDLGKDADFLGLSLKDQGFTGQEIYGAVIGRGHDSFSTYIEKYFCWPN